jgi:hypothetical protein
MLAKAQNHRHAIMMSIPQHPVPFQLAMMSIVFQHYQELQELIKEMEQYERSK